MKRKSGIALFLCYCLIVASAFFYPKWEKPETEATLSWDASGYYWYLPSIIIYKDLKQCAFHDSILKKYHPTYDFQQANLHPSGHYVMKYSCGQSLMMLPWFLVAHAWARAGSIYPADGFSYPYQFMISWGMIAYAFFGLWLLRKLLLRYYSDSTSAWVLIALVFGTNYLDFAGIDNAMSHSSLFTLYAGILCIVDSFYRNPNKAKSILIGLLSGWAVLIRPTEIVVLLLILGWRITSIQELKERYKFLQSNRKLIPIAALCFFLVVLLQPLYWKYVSGDWIVYSYGGQGFDWFHPHVKNFAFSGKSGWLRYTPMMFFAILGMVYFVWKKKSLNGLLIFFGITYYITSAWAIWDYGGNGGRAMIQYYPILAFPMASLFQKIQTKVFWILLCAPIFILFVYLNVWYTYHAHRGNIRVVSGSDAYYWKTVGRWSAPPHYLRLITNPDLYEEPLKDSLLLDQNNFDQDTLSGNITSENGNHYVDLTKEQAFYVHKKISRHHIPGNWIRVWAWLGCSGYEGNEWQRTSMNINFFDHQTFIQSSSIEPQMFLQPNQKEWVNLDARVPEKWDSMEVYFWNRGSNTSLQLDSLRICTFHD